MRQAAGAEHHDAFAAGVGIDRPAQRTAQPEQPPRGRNRVLDHIHRQRNDRHGPVTVGQQRKKRKDTVIDRHFLADRRIEFIRHERPGEMPREIGIAGKVGQRALAPAFIRLGVNRADTQRKGRIGIEEKPVHMVVVNDQKQIRLDVRQPLPRWAIAVKQRRPCGFVLLSLVPRGADAGRVRGADTADQRRHDQSPLPLVWAPICGSVCPTAAPIFSSM